MAGAETITQAEEVGGVRKEGRLEFRMGQEQESVRVEGTAVTVSGESVQEKEANMRKYKEDREEWLDEVRRVGDTMRS